MGARGDGARDGLVRDQADGGESESAASEMREEFGDSASRTHGDAAAIGVNAYLPEVAQIQ